MTQSFGFTSIASALVMFGRYRTPDELPREGYGFGVGGRSDDMDNEDGENEDYENDDDENEDENSKTIKSGSIPSSTGEFHFIFHETDYDLPNFALLYGKMIHTATKETVGVISADLLLKRRKGLYRVCDDRSAALINVARSIINDDGSLRAIMKQAIGDENRARAAAVGGLLHLDEVHILQRYRGRDLGLELIFALLRYLGDRWSLMVTTVAPWDHQDQQRECRKERSDAERTRLYRYFARVGLIQLNTEYWYVERDQLPLAPLPTDAVASLDVLLPVNEPPPKELSEVDKKLSSAAERASMTPSSNGTYGEVAAHEIKELLKAGANVEKACALHHAVAASLYPENWTTLGIEALFKYANVDVNHVDENGHTALHIAANARSEASCRALLERGADPNLRDLDGCTPLDTNTAANTADVQSMIDFEASRAPFRVVKRESAASEQSRRNKPASVLLQRATAARRSQHEARKMLVQCLMYSRRPVLPSDVLRKIHAAVPPLPENDYPTAFGLLDAMTDVMLTGIVSRKELNGQNAKILGTYADRYMVQIVLTGEEIKVKADNVLPLTRPVQASAGAAESDDDDDDDDDEGW
jgi:hypothetical protein